MASEYDDRPPGIPLWFKVGLVIVAFLAYQLGKWVGRSSKSDEP